MLSLADARLGAGPFTLVLDRGDFPTGVEAGASLLVFENGFWLDEWLIDAEHAQVWDAVPAWEKLREVSLSWVVQPLKTLLAQHAEPDSLARLVVDPLASSPLPARIQQVAEQNIPLLSSSLSLKSKENLTKAVKGLAGVGPGLTPAGDDVLLGAMHGLWATRPSEEARETCEVIANAAVPRTHALSAAWLEAAADGEAGEPWHALVMAMATGDEGAFSDAAMRILPTGHTSGSDALGGFLAAVEASLDKS